MDAIERFLIQLFSIRIVRHVLFWGIVIAIAVAFYTFYFDEIYFAFVRAAILFPPYIIATYLLVYYQIPALIYKKKYLRFAIHFIISAYVFSVLTRIATVHIYEPIVLAGESFQQEPIQEILTDLLALFKSYFPRVYSVPFSVAILKLIKDRFEEQQKQKQLEKEKMTAELNFLRAQIHPHFLFNTLNNLYLLTLKKSDKAPETVIKLSEIMDYMLYQCNEPLVPLEKEIKLVENYIGLEMLRYGDRLKVTFEKNVDELQRKIAPLLLLSMVENAFKHGASSEIGQPRIEIGLIQVENSLNFRVFNTKSMIPQKDEQHYKKGIGVSNTKRQLELIYPNRHELVVEEEDASYMVDLFIDLNSENL
ncbi:MAG: sensor histidine kinase [Flammeovirgaceae bacterium]